MRMSKPEVKISCMHQGKAWTSGLMSFKQMLSNLNFHEHPIGTYA